MRGYLLAFTLSLLLIGCAPRHLPSASATGGEVVAFGPGERWTVRVPAGWEAHNAVDISPPVFGVEHLGPASRLVPDAQVGFRVLPAGESPPAPESMPNVQWKETGRRKIHGLPALFFEGREAGAGDATLVEAVVQVEGGSIEVLGGLQPRTTVTYEQVMEIVESLRPR